MSLKKKILAFLSSEEPKVQLASEKLENGTVLISEDFKEGMPIFIKSEGEEDENVKLPIGEYQMEDGRILKVEVEGEIASLEQAKIESEESEEMEEEDYKMEEEEQKMDVVEYDEAHMEAMHQAIADLTARIEALEGPKESMEEEKVEMSAEESVEEVKEEPKEEATEEATEEPKEEVKEEAKEEAKEEVKEEEVKEEPKEEVAPIAHSPEVSDEKRVRFYFPKN